MFAYGIGQNYFQILLETLNVYSCGYTKALLYHYSVHVYFMLWEHFVHFSNIFEFLLGSNRFIAIEAKQERTTLKT